MWTLKATKEKQKYCTLLPNQIGAGRNAIFMTSRLTCLKRILISLWHSAEKTNLKKNWRKNISAQYPYHASAEIFISLTKYGYSFSLLSLFLSENPNIIHLNSSKVGGIGSVAARIYNFLPKSNPLQAKSYKLKATIIFTVHGWAFNEDRPLWQRIAIRFVSWVTVVCSHAIIAVSEYNARQGRSMFFARDKIIVIHNGITTPNFLPREQAQAELLGARAKNVPKNALLMGAIAELTKNKGITYALMGIRHLVNDMELPRPIVYVVIGDGEGKVPLVNLINEFNLQNIVHLVGSKKDAATLLKALDIFLFPSIKRGSAIRTSGGWRSRTAGHHNSRRRYPRNHS